MFFSIFLEECNFQQFCENFRTSQLVQLAYCNLSPSSYQSDMLLSNCVMVGGGSGVDPTLHISHTWGKLLLAFCWRSSNWAENENLFFLLPCWVLQILLVQIHEMEMDYVQSPVQFRALHNLPQYHHFIILHNHLPQLQSSSQIENQCNISIE